MSYSDDTINRISGFDSWTPAPQTGRLIQTQSCAGLSRDELADERYALMAKGWKNIRVIESREGDWTEYRWYGWQ